MEGALRDARAGRARPGRRRIEASVDGASARNLLGGIGERVVFVVGKGGVGKSTTASALALREARSNLPVHLVSTDPAHSLGDILELDGREGALHRDVCGAPLAVEEFDAPAYARRWIEDASPAISQLFELGTYLDGADVDEFLDLSLPGLDEVMSALRIVDLLDEAPGRVVVDTAPTGHALRLLDSGRVLESWVGALDAMSRKATAVAEGLTRSRVRLDADSFVEGLAGRIRRFEREVLERSAAVVVYRTGPVVASETRRLAAELEARGVRIGAWVRIGPPGPSDPHVPDLTVPWERGMAGCDALARWGLPEGTRAARPAAHGSLSGSGGAAPDGPGRVGPAPRKGVPDRPPPLSRSILSRELVLFVGKGGVGKSTCAAAWAVLAAERGPVTLVSTDPAGSLESLFGVEVPPEGVEVGDGLRLVQIDAEAELERLLRDSRREVEEIFEGMGVGTSAELDREVMGALLELAPPGIDEIFGLATILQATSGGDRIVVVDSAPTGHLLRLIRMPELARSWVRALMRVLLKYRSVASLGTSGRRLLELGRRLEGLRELLVDAERTAVLLVTVDEPVVRSESERLLRSLEEAGLEVSARILNRAGAEAVRAAADGRQPAIVVPEMPDPPAGREALRALASRWEEVA